MAGKRTVAARYVMALNNRQVPRTSLQIIFRWLESAMKFLADHTIKQVPLMSLRTGDELLDRTIEEIRSDDYGARLNIASGISLYLKEMWDQPQIYNLVLCATPKNIERMNTIFYELTLAPFDEQYRNPNDDALATLAAVLRHLEFSHDHGLNTAKRLRELAHNACKCFWLWEVLS